MALFNVGRRYAAWHTRMREMKEKVEAESKPKNAVNGTRKRRQANGQPKPRALLCTTPEQPSAQTSRDRRRAMPGGVGGGVGKGRYTQWQQHVHDVSIDEQNDTDWRIQVWDRLKDHQFNTWALLPIRHAYQRTSHRHSPPPTPIDSHAIPTPYR